MTHTDSPSIARLSEQLFDTGCVQFGRFTLKSGLTSPIYVDLRLLVSHPPLLRRVAHALAAVASGLDFDRFAAIPFAGLPIGTALTLEMGRPLIYPRPAKAHGTRRSIEGAFQAGETVLVVDDLITRGTSKIEAIQPLEEAGLVVRDVLVFIDRQQGGTADLAERGYTLHAVTTLDQILEALRAAGRVTADEYTAVIDYLRDTRS